MAGEIPQFVRLHRTIRGVEIVEITATSRLALFAWCDTIFRVTK
jgi:hypothetical protein